MTASYVIKSQLTEKQIEADVAMYLGSCSKHMPFRLLDINEQATGADKLLDVIMPVYMQFKKSEGLRPLKSSDPKKRRAKESRLQDIRRFRSKNELADSPTLFFGLRALAETAIDFQHNILLLQHNPPVSYGIYVAPLYLDTHQYYMSLASQRNCLSDPWVWRRYDILHDFGPSPWLSRYDLLPFLKSHISIHPHEKVNTHNHYYAFGMSGGEISWHSPAIMDRGPSRLSDFMTARTRDFILGTGDLPSAEAVVRAARRTVSALSENPESIIFGETPLEQIRSYGRWLLEKTQIHQILLCADSREIYQIRENLRGR